MMDVMPRVLWITTLLLHVAVARASAYPPHNDNIGHTVGSQMNEYAITSIYPDSGPTTGGTDIILTVDGGIDGDDLACIFESDPNNNTDYLEDVQYAVAQWISPTEIRCSSPEWSVSGANASLSLECEGAVIVTSPSPFHYYETPHVDSIYPTSGAALGGTAVKLRGSGFLPSAGMICRFGIVDVPASWKGRDEAACTSPPGVVGASRALSLSLNGVDFSASPAMYRYTEPPGVQTVWPAKGSVTGGTVLTLEGQGFEGSPALKCVFRLHNNNSIVIVEAAFVSSTELTCTSPAVEEPTPTIIHVSVNGVDASANGVGFDYIEDAVISLTRPASGPITGGSWVRLIGSGLVNGDSLRCRFGGSSPVPGFWVSPSEIQCVLPRGITHGIVKTTLSLNGVDYTTSFVEFLYYKHPTMTSIFPTFGTSSGGTLVTVHGTGYLPSSDMLCRFGFIYVNASFVNEEEVTCVSPPGIAGSSHSVLVSINGVDFSPDSIDWFYKQPPEVHTIDPKWADRAGGTIMKVVGAEFEDTEELACIFGSRKVNPIRRQASFLSSTELQCPCPPMSAPSEVALRVTVNGVDISSDSVRFEYVDPAVVAKMDPVRGPVMGGTPVILTGTGFLHEDAICCQFGDATVPAEWISWTMVRCESPPSSASDVVVSYSNDGINFVRAASLFSFTVPATVLSIEPTSGTINSRTEVRIFGEGFTDEAGWKCLFNQASVPTAFASSSEMLCHTAPMETRREVTLNLMQPDGHIVKTGLIYHYYEDLQLISMFPKSSPVLGGTTITIELRGLHEDSHYKCIFGGVGEASVMLLNDTFIECVAPQWETIEETSLAVKSNSSAAITESTAFTFYRPPDISSASPLSFYSGFSTDFTVRGESFLNSPHSKCRIGNQEFEARWISSDEIVCHYVSGSIEPCSISDLPLLTSANGVDFHDSGISLSIHPELTVTEITPTSGRGTRVFVKGTGFSDRFDYRCLFGTKFVDLAEYLSPNEIICEPAPLSLPGRKSFWICVDGGDCTGREDLAFEYLDQLHLLGVSPTEGPIYGGTLVHVESNHRFGAHSLCSFGNKRVKIEASDDGLFGICASPPFKGDSTAFERVEFSVSANGQEFSHESFQFEYQPNDGSNITDGVELHHAVRVSHISPAMGLPGTNVTVSGSGLEHLKGAVCRFGFKQVPVVPVSYSSIICTAPWIAPFNSVSFNVIDPSKQVEIYHGNENITFTYVDTPLISQVEPAVIVKTNQSTAIEIRGQNFEILTEDALQCRVGSSEAPARLNDSSGSITCNLSLPAKGYFPVELLSEQFGGISSSQATIQVIELPRLAHLEPPMVVAHDRKTDVMVKGKNFAGHNLTCVFDDLPSHAAFISDSEVLCRVPEDCKAQSYEVRLFNGGLVDPTQFLLLEIIPPPSIAAVTPPLGQSGSNVSITGKSFHPRMKCQFGSHIVETLFRNSTLVQCISPAYSYRGSVPVNLTIGGVTVSTGPQVFFTFVDLSVASIGPRFGDTVGGTPVTFDMKEDSPDVVSHCIFGEYIAPAIIRKSVLVCVSPPTPSAGHVNVGVTANGVDFTMSDLTFEYTEPATFYSMHPTSGPESGGMVVTLTGSGFVNSTQAACYLGSVEVAGQWLSDGKLACKTPLIKPGNYSLRASFNGVDMIHTHHFFEIYPRMSTLLSLPSFGETGGGTPVQVYGTNFRKEDMLSCRFGSVSVDARYVGLNMIECFTPKWEFAGLVDLTVASDKGDTAVVHSGFTFYLSFHLSWIHPSTVFLRGGTEVTVKGDHFSQSVGLVKCVFPPENIAVEATVVSENEVLCTTPPVANSGNGEFVLTHGADKFVLPRQAFEYEDEIILHSVSPSVLPSNTERSIFVYGSTFKNRKGLGCRISSQSIEAGRNEWIRLKATFVHDSQVFCTVPKGLKPGAYNLSVTHNGQDFSKATVDFSMIDPFLVKSLHPLSGSPDTLKVILLTGNNFQDLERLACLVDEKYVVPSHFINTTSIECLLPLKVNTGAVSVALILDGVPISSGPQLFFTFIDLSVASITPSFGGITGGTPVTFDMKEDSPNVVSHCIFGEHIAPAIIRDSVLVCISPPMPSAGHVHVGVTSNGVDFSKSYLTFEFTKTAVFSTMHPKSGPESGGTVVVLAGSNFVNSQQLACYFGNVEVAGQWLSDVKLTCRTPRMKPGNYKVRVTLNGVDTLRTPWQFTVFKEIDVLYASPSSGSILGGTEVSVIGKSFVSTDHFTCQFGEWGRAKAAFVSSTEVTCLSPDISKGTDDPVDVGLQLSLNGGVDFSLATVHFRFTPPAVIHSIFPDQGSLSGGTQVTVKGASMFSSIASNAALCIFGSETVPASLVSTTELTCVSPPHHTSEEVFFAITLNGADLVPHRASTYLYLPIVKTVAIKPSGGPLTGGTIVTARGVGIGKSLAARCNFGSEHSDGIVHISGQVIQCKSPPHPPGTVDFSITTEDNEIIPGDVVFEFYKPPTILFSQPTSGPHYGGTLVRIYGNDFRSNVDYLCYFGVARVPGQFIATDAIECSSPPIIDPDTDQTVVDLLVVEENSNFTATTLHYSYVPSASLDHLRPQYIAFDEDGSVSIFGRHLKVTSDAWCRFTLPSKADDDSHYYETVRASSVHEGRVDCQVPMYPLTNMRIEAFVEVSTNGWDWSSSRLSFVYAPKPTILSADPQIGSVNGGTLITIHGTDFLQESNLGCVFEFVAVRDHEVDAMGSIDSVALGSVEAKWISPEEIFCIAPVAPYPANVTLSLHFNESRALIEGTYFAYHSELSLAEASPMRGFISGGTVVTVQGTGFLDAPTLSCQFGSTAVPATFISSNSIKCTSPPVNQAQHVTLSVSLNGKDYTSLLDGSGRKLFGYDKEIDLFRTIPSHVAVSGNNTGHGYISVIGVSIINTTSLSCRYGLDQFASAKYVSESEVRCNLPKTAEVGEIGVEVSLNGVDFSRKTTSVSFIEPAIISSVTPRRIQEGSATDFLIQGENFLRSSDLQCRFGLQGHIWSPARWISDSSLKCVNPPLNLTASMVEYIGVSVNGGHDTGRQQIAIELSPRAHFRSMRPTVGYVGGGTEVIITLGNLKYLADLMCQFATEAAPATLVSANSIACKSPPYHPGEVTVKLVSVYSGVHILAAGTFEYLQTPHIASLYPEMGQRGTAVSVNGTGFTGVTHCRFDFNGDIGIVLAYAESDNNLICYAPASEESAEALVQISHNGQEFIGVGHVFRFRASPRLLSIAPSFGGDAGGKQVRITGENFIDTPSMCRFGTTLVDAIYISPSALICIAPTLKTGIVPVSITSNGVDFVTNKGLLYEAIKLPQIKSVEPTIGIVNRNTSIVLHTTALRENGRLACHFNEETVLASYLSPNSVSCAAPTVQLASVVNVSISVGGERYLAGGLNTVEFRYIAEPRVTSMSRNFGWMSGGAQEVILSVKDFEPFHSYEISCSFGDLSNIIKALSVRENLVTCHLPQFSQDTMEQHAPILIQISDGMNTFHVKSPVFTYLEPSIVTKADPPVGSIRGGSLVRVSGINFFNMHGLQCLFGDAAVSAEFLEEREIQCTSPEWKGGPKTVNVHVGIDGGAKLTLASHASFEYRAHPTVEGISPKFGGVLGGTRVTIHGNALSWPDVSSHLSCRFGNSTMVPAAAPSNESELVCISPPLDDATLAAGGERAVSLSVYANHGQLLLASSDDRFVYADNIEVESLSPNSGPFDGGTVVVVSARGLDHLPVNEITCHFGNNVVPATYSRTDDSWKCASPYIDSYTSSLKTVMLALGLNGSRVVSSIGMAFTYYRAPLVTSIAPSSGFTEGGEEVFLKGHNFRKEGGLGCIFGHVASPKAVWLSDTSIVCTSPAADNKVVTVRVTNNGMDYNDGGSTSKYLFTHRPDASKLEPSVVQWEAKTNITITGKNLIHASACSYGDINKTYPAFNITENSVCCEVPPGMIASLSFLPSLSQTNIPIFLHLENGMIATGLEIKYGEPPPKEPEEVNQPLITSISPNHGSSVGGDWVRVYGMDFLNTEDLACNFGESVVGSVHFVSPLEVRCITPTHLPGVVSFDVINSVSGGNQNNFTFTFVLDLSLVGIHPSFGSVNGGTEVHVFGSFPSQLLDGVELDTKCKFGMGGVVEGKLVSQNEITCSSPPSSVPETVEVSVSFDGGQNFAQSSSWFSYGHEGEIESLVPNYGHPSGGSSIVVVGKNFQNFTGLKCLFGEISVAATFLSMGRVSCLSPPRQLEAEGKVALRLASEGGIGSSWRYFEYIERPQITSISPLFGDSSFGEAALAVKGVGFRDVLQLMCAFGKVNVRPAAIDTTQVLCPIPRHSPGVVDFHIVDKYALFEAATVEGTPLQFQFTPEASVFSVNPTWNVTQAGATVFARGTNFDASGDVTCVFGRMMINATVMTDSLLSCPTPFRENKNDVKVAIGLPGSTQLRSLTMDPFGAPAAPNGTIMNHNVTLCEPGTFQPQNGQGQCLRCPIGFMCTLFGLSRPILCPAGAICERLGLVVPSSPCMSGHFCNNGTKMSSHIARTTTETWLLEEESGVLMTTMSNSAWDYRPRTAPATGRRRIFHPPVDANVKAEQPFPCPIGFFCREGVYTAEHCKSDYGTPQPCTPGYFCPRGSATLEGTGGCPTGFYCPTQTLAIPCEVGHYCVGTANTSPLPCYPGSYSSTVGRSNCQLCEIGFQCPGFGRAAPELCRGGWVCDEEGLSIPSKRCPSGFVCEEGTTTNDPGSIFGTTPKPCTAGSFCLEGVATDEPFHTEWLPSFEMGSLAPLKCAEGYYCPSNSSTPMGGGKCFPGHYCPENSPYPIQVPPGAFAGSEGGAIVGSLCLPGTFSPRPGQISCSPCPAGSSCLSYGTYVPRICRPGTYRSKVDATHCKPCPTRTYSFASGLTDISQCLPCAEGRVCSSEGMADLMQSDVCSEGNVCGYMTDRVTQFMNQCPSGFCCGNETTTLNQYSNHCLSGNYCERGTTSRLRTRDKCGKGFYCASGTPNPEPFITRCPRQTTSLAGAEDMDFCSPSLVAICDKMPFSETNPFNGLSYYPVERATSDHEESAELLVAEKVIPFNYDSTNVLPWKNGTVEVFRSCPAYGTLSEDNSDRSNRDPLTVIGRNFRNSSTLTCRYRICLDLSWETDTGTTVIVPEQCETATYSNVGESITEVGAYISGTRVACPMPAFSAKEVFRPLNRSMALLGSYKQLCLRDDKGQMFLSQECSNSDLASGRCAFEDSIPSFGLRKRVYSLVVPCLEGDVLSGFCDDIPTLSSRLNPCLTQRMIVDVSNNGKKFSGDSTIVPYTSLDSFRGASLDADKSHRVQSSHATYLFIPDNSLAMLQVVSSDIEKKHLASSIGADAVLCLRSSSREEGQRLSEDGWFESPYMSRFHLSFDWRHLPSHLVYDEHYKLAIYVVPSRCREAKCKGLRSHSYEENIPCLQPVELPVWFTDDSVDKNQMMNLTLTSLDDARFRVEVQIVNGLALPMANFFKKTMSVVMEHPQRADTLRGSKRKMSPFVSWEEEVVDNHKIFGIRYDDGHSQQVSLPRNLPPRWKSFERGRVLVGMNTTRDNEAPTIKDGNESTTGADFWDNPYRSASVAKHQSDIYFETFHGVSQDGTSGSYKYEHGSLILPYLPYFSNCREFDSHVLLWALVESAAQCQLPGATDQFPEGWWRRRIPPLPHQDDVKAIGPSDFVKFYPVADWCERNLHCSFEEDLPKPDVTPRWFEAESGTALFSIIRDPIDYAQYTGRESSIAGSGDGGGQKYINSINTLQTFIPAKVDRSPSLTIEGGCKTACYPRKVTVDISYHQINVHSKRIVQVQVLYNEFDKDSSNDEYELQIKFYALNYQELVVKFAFSRGLFLLLFTQIGVGTVVAAFVYWVVIRLTTNLERPPPLRITGFLWLTFPHALGGFLLGLLPIGVVTTGVFYLLKGYLVFTPDADPDGRRWLFPSSTRLHYSDVNIDPDNLKSTRQGRTGLAFITMALISFYFTTRMFVPRANMAEQQNKTRALVNWKRGNLVCSSVVMSLFLVIIVEWSFWGSFGRYIWEAIIFMKILSIFVGSIVDKQLGEALLSAPVMTAMGLVQGIVTMSANDFMDFLLSYIVGFGFLLLERMYIGPLQAEAFGWVYGMVTYGRGHLQAPFPSIFGRNQEQTTLSNSDDALPEENNETVEPLLGSYASYTCDTLSLLYAPFIMVVIMAFRDEAEITKLYGIKEADMEYYVLFALTIIPFQIIADILLHNALELLHGWKIHEYLEYCKVRFQQREVWWKGLETNTIDECIEESLRSMDQLCFSSQYYMLNTIHVNAMVYFVMGVEMMSRAKYTVFGDPAMFPIITSILLCSLAVKLILTWIARMFGLWRIKHEKRDWHSRVLKNEGNPDIDQWDDVQVDLDQHVMEQRITDQTFRYKFLNYNRSWILSQLPEMITPRVTANQRPYMINQFARILGQVNGDISSDSDSDDEPEFETLPMTASTRSLARTWLMQANRRLRLKKLVQPLIQQSRGNECQICLSRNLLQVETLQSIEDIDEQFKNSYGTDEMDQVVFKRFWQRNQRYQTICLPCIQKRKTKEHDQIITDDRSLDDDSDDNLASDDLTHTSKSILASWYAAAKRNVNQGN